MEALYTAAQTRALDRCAIERHGVPGIILMSRAAHVAFDALLGTWPETKSVVVLCGTGNNGGDGFLIADLARKRGLSVIVLQVGDQKKCSGDALMAREQALANGVLIENFDAALALPEGVVVDAMLGTGLGGDVRGDYRAAIDAINSASDPVLAVDIPSGLCADTGRVLGAAVRADLTVTFIGLKRGQFTMQAPDYCGELEFSDLAVPHKVYSEIQADCYRLELEPLLTLFPARSATAHKGLYGSVLVVGGDYGMAGAALMAAQSALRCGAGLVHVATRPEHVSAMVARIPEAMARGVVTVDDLTPLLDGADVVVIGPGLGQSEWSHCLLRAALASGKPMVVDADGLNMLAADALSLGARTPCDNWVLTPHPGEAARLLGESTTAVQADRFAAATAPHSRYGGVVVLKGNGTLIADSDSLLLSDYGNPGMASGGMGDVLSGVIGSLLAQGLAASDAAALGVCLHGAAADLAATEGQAGLLATDLMPHLRALLG